MIQTLCSSNIDWSATGDMLQGIGTLVGAGAVLLAARWGANSFQAWKRQKLAERHLEQAERILTAVYRTRRGLEYVRGPMMWAHELNAAEETLKADPGWDQQTSERQRRLVTAQAFYDRLNKTKEERQELELCQPMARALFGENLEKELELLNRQFWLVQCDVDAHIDDDGSDAEFSTKIRRGMWATRSNKHPDPIEETVQASVAKIEEICLPVLRMDDGATSSPS